MADNFFQRSLAACYFAIGVPGLFEFPAPLTNMTLTVIDHVNPQDANVGVAHFADIEPQCSVRVSELTAAGLTSYDQVLDAYVTFNGNRWVITKYHENCTPYGPGELDLQLRKA